MELAFEFWSWSPFTGVYGKASDLAESGRLVLILDLCWLWTVPRPAPEKEGDRGWGGALTQGHHLSSDGGGLSYTLSLECKPAIWCA